MEREQRKDIIARGMRCHLFPHITLQMQIILNPGDAQMRLPSLYRGSNLFV
jgi:hypothetical protein